MAAAQIDFLHLELVVDASRLAYWLGEAGRRITRV